MVAKYIRTPYNYSSKVKSEQFEIVNDTVSQTEAAASISPREIMYRYTSGNLPDIQKEAIDDQEPISFDDYKSYYDLDYDLSDLTRDRIRLLELKEEVEKSLEAKKAARREQDKKELEEFENYKKLKQKKAELEKQAATKKE